MGSGERKTVRWVFGEKGQGKSKTTTGGEQRVQEYQRISPATTWKNNVGWDPKNCESGNGTVKPNTTKHPKIAVQMTTPGKKKGKGDIGF